jgi:hypothetical protein
MSEWLAEFATRIYLNVWPFFLSAALAFLVAGITVATSSYRIAIARPAETLRRQ